MDRGIARPLMGDSADGPERIDIPIRSAIVAGSHSYHRNTIAAVVAAAFGSLSECSGSSFRIRHAGRVFLRK